MCRSARDVERGDNVNHEVYDVLPVVDAWRTRIPHVVGTVNYECNVQQTSCNVRYCTTSAQCALSVNVTHRHNIIHVILSDHHKCAGLPWRLDFNPHTHPIPTEKPVETPTVFPYLQNPKILHIHIPNPVSFH